MNYIVEKRQFVEDSYIINFTKKNCRGEKLSLWISKCMDDNSKNSLPKLWYRNGAIKTVLPTYWSVQTFCYDKKGNCYGRYNPTVKIHESGKRLVLNFDWMLEATEGNKEKLIKEVYRLFIGKSFYCSAVLQLLDKDEGANYCKALNKVLDLYPESNKEELEEELSYYI